MKGNTQKVVDLNYYRKCRVQAPPTTSVPSGAKVTPLAFVAVPIPFLLPIPFKGVSR